MRQVRGVTRRCLCRKSIGLFSKNPECEATIENKSRFSKRTKGNLSCVINARKPDCTVFVLAIS